MNGSIWFIFWEQVKLGYFLEKTRGILSAESSFSYVQVFNSNEKEKFHFIKQIGEKLSRRVDNRAEEGFTGNISFLLQKMGGQINQTKEQQSRSRSGGGL